jgi:predicted RNA polymerase sigma factor
MYKVIDGQKGKAYYPITDTKSPQYGNTITIDLETASQDELKLLFEIGHPFVKDDKKVAKTE